MRIDLAESHQRFFRSPNGADVVQLLRYAQALNFVTLRSSHINLRLRKIIAYKQQRRVKRRCDAVAHTVPKIERSGVSAFAEVLPRLPCVRLHRGRKIKRNQVKRMHQIINRIAVIADFSCGENHARFEQAMRADEALLIALESLKQCVGIGLIKRNGDQHRCVDHAQAHVGSPCLS